MIPPSWSGDHTIIPIWSYHHTHMIQPSYPYDPTIIMMSHIIINMSYEDYVLFIHKLLILYKIWLCGVWVPASGLFCAHRALYKWGSSELIELWVTASIAPVDVVRGGYLYIYRPVTCYIPSESHPLRHLPAGFLVQALISTALGWGIGAAAACCKGIHWSRTQRCSRLLDAARVSLFSLITCHSR